MQNEELRQTQHELEVSREKYLDLYDLAPVGYLTLNEPGLIQEANLTAARLLGVARTDLLQQPLTRFILREDLGIFHQHRQQLLETRAPQYYELRLMRPGDTPIWVRGVAILAQGHNTAAPVCRMTLSDLTERKQAEVALRESEEHYRLLAEVTQDMIYVIGRDDRVQYVNTAAARALGHHPQKLVGKTRADLFPPEIAEQQWHNLQKVFESGEPSLSEARIILPHGERWINAHLLPFRREGGRVTAVMGVSRDLTERKQAEADRERLAQFERLAQLMKCANDIILLTDDDGRILEANERALETYGYSLAELRQKTLEDLRTPESRAELPHQTVQLETDGRAVFEEMHQRRDGFAFPVEISARFLQIAGVRFRLGIARDITEHKRAEEALRESELFVRSVLNSLTAHIAVLDAQGVIVAVNEAWRRFARENGGADTAAYLGTNYLAVCEESFERGKNESVAAALRGLRAVMNGQQAEFSLEYPCHSPNQRRWFSLQATRFPGEDPVRLVVAHENITERKQAERELRESEEKFAVAFHASPNLMAITRVADGTILEVNEGYSRLLGYTRGESIGKTTADLSIWVDPADRATFVAHLKKSGQVTDFETRLRHKDGSALTAVESARTIKLQDERCLLVVAYDITERKQAEKRVQMFSQEIIAAREEERKRVSSVLHHDVGSLAVGIAAHLDAIQEDLRSGKPREALKWMKRTRKLFGESVARLKKLAIELRPPELDVIGLRAALRQYFSQVTERAGLRIHFKETLGRRRVPGDTATILFRIAQEALTNAITHGHATRVDLDLSASKEEVRLTVRNNGKAFDPSGKAAQVTSHMGLRVMHEMAVSAGGICTVDSGRGKGTTVRVRLPIADWQKSRNHQSAIA
jgi:PAS domain S-box-containing protein